MGRAHHRHYLVWCELGRTAFLREHGMSYAALERGGVMLPVARASLEYRRAALYDEVVRVDTWIERIRSRDIVFAYHMRRVDDDTTIATARITLVSADAEGHPVRFPMKLRRTLEALVTTRAVESEP